MYLCKHKPVCDFCGIDLSEYYHKTHENVNNSSFDITDLIRTDEELSSWTGIHSFQLLRAIKDCLELTLVANSKKCYMDLDKLVILVFIKLKMNLTFVTIATLFQISDRTVAKIFYFIIPYLKSALSVAVRWPSMEEILGNMPKQFKSFQSTRVVLDCFESKIPSLKCLSCRILTYSSYKGAHTAKICLGATPAGLISYKSTAYGGKTSDKYIFNEDKVLSTHEHRFYYGR